VAHTSLGRRPCGWRRVAVPVLAPPEALDRVAADRSPVARARSALVKLPSPAEVSVARRVAPHWLRALPPHRFDGLGVFLVVPDSRNYRPVSSSRGVRLLFRARLRRIRPFPLLRSGSLALAGSFQRLGSASPGVLAPVETPLRRLPLLTRTAARPSGKTKVARPSSVPSSGFLPLSTVQATHAARHEPLRGSPLRRGVPTLRGLVACRSRLFGAALQSFPFPGSRTCSRRPLLPCGFASDCRQRGVNRSFTVAFPAAPALCLEAHPEVNRDA
jgi:hypothetical protein